eukprot:4360870-Lingulodinium_polyedra.AAC.1
MAWKSSVPRLHHPGPLSSRPLLVLSMDEGSPGYSMTWYFTYFLQARVVFVRDMFHREWTDCSRGIKHR